MSKGAPTSYNTVEMWVAYATTLLGKNPEWWSKGHKNYKEIQHYFLYRKYTNESGKLIVVEVFSYKLFRAIVDLYFKKAVNAIVAGECLDMTSGLGKIAVRRVERDHSYKKIDIPETRKQPLVWSEERQAYIREKLIYFTGDDWLRIGWHKFGKLTNETVYRFTPTSSPARTRSIGFTLALSKAVKADPVLRYKYIYYPLIPKRS